MKNLYIFYKSLKTEGDFDIIDYNARPNYYFIL